MKMTIMHQATTYYLLLTTALVCTDAEHSVRQERAVLPTYYTNSWAVQVKGGKDQANDVASRGGFVNLGKVPELVY